MFERISVSIIIGLMVVLGSTGHEFGEQHCSVGFWGSTDWSQVKVDDEEAYVAKHCVLAHNKDMYPREGVGKSALHYVIDNISMSQFLIENGADVNAKNQHDKTPLHYVVNNVSVMQLLIENGADVNVKGKFGDTPLHDAFLHGNLEAIEMLIENGADVNARDNHHNVPLHLAVKHNYLIASGKLIASGADVNSISRSISNFYIESCNIFSEWRSRERNRKGYSPLHIAALCGYRGIAHLLVESGSDIDKCSKEDGTPLHIAAKNGHADIVEILIDYGAQVSAVAGKYGVTPLYHAVEGSRDYYAVCELLVNAGANIYAPARRPGKYYSPRLPIEQAGELCSRAMRLSGHSKKRSKLIKPSLDCYKVNLARKENRNE